MGKGIDIIIPVYNAYDDLRICLDSLYKYTDLHENRLILINDNSPDERIKSFLDSQQKENVIIIHNSINKGFSNNINIGIAQSENRDVMLLNSDTIVTKSWVEKIIKCAYSDCSIGTVTPLSNNATLCSVPNFCEENTLPEGMTVDQVAAIVEECSLRKYPRITVAHGFCMFIKREVINIIGNFDAETFGRGYGEENDFCNRAEQMGFIHVMCDDTYIYHSGTKSFVSKEKEAYIREHDCILNERYPQQMQKNAIHCQENPNRWVGKNIAYHLDIWNGKKNIFYLLQSDFREGADDNVGGTQLHIKHLTMGLRENMNVFVAARDNDYLQITAYVGDNEHVFRFYIGQKEPFPLLRNRKLAKIFRTVLLGFKIDLVHVHHTAATSLDIYYEADRLAIPIVFTAHDFYYICPNEKLLDSCGNLCIEKEKKDCEKCLKEKKGIYENNNYLHMWRKWHGEAIGMCRYVITPSNSAKEIFARYYPQYDCKIIVIEHGIDAQGVLEIAESDINKSEDVIWQIDKVDMNCRCPAIYGKAYMKGEQEKRRKIILKVSDEAGNVLFLPTNYDIKHDVLDESNQFFAFIPNQKLNGGKITIMLIILKDNKYYSDFRTEIIEKITFTKKADFRVAFIGGINEEKGGEIVTEIIKHGNSQIEWYVFGGIGEKSLFNLQKQNLIKTSYYHSDDIETLLRLHLIDVVCILSKWPETFSYTLSEAIIGQCPVITTDIGALGERTRRNKYGSVVRMGNTKQIAENVIDIISQWRVQKDEYQQLQAIVRSYNHKTIKIMCAEYAELYQELFYGKEQDYISGEIIERMNQAYISDYGCKDEIENLKYKYKAMENRIKKIDNNATIKIMLKLTEKEFPFKRQLKNLIMKHL